MKEKSKADNFTKEEIDALKKLAEETTKWKAEEPAQLSDVEKAQIIETYLNTEKVPEQFQNRAQVLRSNGELRVLDLKYIEWRKAKPDLPPHLAVMLPAKIITVYKLKKDLSFWDIIDDENLNPYEYAEMSYSNTLPTEGQSNTAPDGALTIPLEDHFIYSTVEFEDAVTDLLKTEDKARDLAERLSENAQLLEDIKNTHFSFMPNSRNFSLLLQSMTAPQYVGKSKIRPGEQISIWDMEGKITIKKKTEEEDLIINIPGPADLYTKNNKASLMLFCYVFQKLAHTPGRYDVYLTYKELVDVGIYADTRAARRGVQRFFDYMTGKGNRAGSVSISGKIIQSQKKGAGRYYNDQSKQILFTGIVSYEGGVELQLNQRINLNIFFMFYTVLPTWAYKLKTLNAFLLVRYIFYVARQSGDRMTWPEPEDQDPEHPYMIFNISFEAIRDALGLPTPEEVKTRYNRDYKARIINKIMGSDKMIIKEGKEVPAEVGAIAEIEEVISTLKDPEQKLLHNLTPRDFGNGTNIHDFLKGYLAIGIDEKMARNFITAAKTREKKIAAFNRKVEEKQAEQAAKKKT